MGFESNILVTRGINTEFPMHYEATKHGISKGVSFNSADFVRPFHGNARNARVLLSNIVNQDNTTSPGDTDVIQDDPMVNSVVDTTSGGCVRRTASILYLE